MKHCEYRRNVEGAKRALLFVHGIVGTPDHFSDIIDMVPEDVTFWNILVDGHGGRVRDFANTSMKKWEAQIKAVLDELSATHDEIYVVAHSLGALLTIKESLENPKIIRIFMLQPALTPCVKWGIVTTVLKIFFNNIKPDDLVVQAALKRYSIDIDRNVFGYFGWIPRFVELFVKARKTVRLLDELKIPCVAFVSKKDEVVAQKSGKILRRYSNVEVFDMKNSGHFYYEKNDIELLRHEFAGFIAEMESEKYVG